MGASEEQPASQQRFRLRTEGARERDVLRHLHPWAEQHKDAGLHQPAFPADANESMREPHACPDTALTAFAQLCALRLRVRRCYVTLISSSMEYVLAEATRTMSLQYDCVEDPKDKAWLGTCSFLRDEGLNALALDSWRRARHVRETPEDNDFYYTNGVSQHWLIISDVRGNEQYAQRTFVQRSPSLRFYASVPLRAANGSVLGSLTVVDDAPRYGLSVTDVAFMEDVADTITEHLDATVVRSQRQRSERLIQSLGLFNSGKSSLRHWWIQQEDARMSNVGRHKMQKMSPNQRRAATNQEFGFREASSSDPDKSDASGVDNVLSSPTSLQNSNASLAQDQARVASQDFAQGRSFGALQRRRLDSDGSVDSNVDLSPSQKHQAQSAPRNVKTRTSDENFSLAGSSQQTYARASNLIREALAADGVVFVNANSATPKARNATGNLHLAHGGSTPGERFGYSDTETSDGSSGAQQCRVDAFSTKERSSLRPTDGTHHFAISEKFLSLLVRRYPRGQIFNFAQDGACYSSSGEDSMASGSNSESRAHKKIQRTPRDGQRLGEIMIGAKTIAFYPIWDEAHDRWCSGVFVWCTSPVRFFDPAEDVTYLASWSHSILAELRRLETLAADRAKGSFISSVSHELRSPLHGILAGVEFLQESELNSFQREMSHTISMAGRTLLDTVDHILDYSKMSNFTRSQKRQRAFRDYAGDSGGTTNSNEIGVTANVNLALLTEEVIEVVASAHRFQNLRKLGDDNVSIALNIPWRKNWMVRLQPGSWTRILNNLVGNSLKYTAEGLVSVKIQVEDPKSVDDPFHRIRLIVQDTGIGISPKFLSSELYTPFRQESSHSSGTGLGLSIVRQICKDMGADLKITSDLGKGTCAMVDFKARFVVDPADLTSDVKSTEDAKIVTSRELNVKFFRWITPETPGPSPLSVGHSVLETAEDWLGCASSLGPSFTAVGGPVVYAIADDDLLQWANEGAESLRTKMVAVAKISSHVLVLGRSLTSVASSVQLQDLPFTPVFVHQPIGPSKLIRAITSDQSSTRLGRVNEERTTSIDSLSTPVSETRRMSPLSSTLQDHDDFAWFPAEGTVRQTDTAERQVMGASELSIKKSTSSTCPRQSVDTSASPINSTSTPFSSRASASSTNGDGDTEPQRDSILLVEDNEVNMKLLVALMRKLSLSYTVATDGRQAVDAYRANPFSFLLILMDMSMPVMDGFTATSKIRETERKHHLARCPIVALTGVTSGEAASRAFASGVDEFFSKPVHMKEVKSLVDRARKNEIIRQQPSE